MKRERIVIQPSLQREEFLRRSGAAVDLELEEEAVALFVELADSARPKALVQEVLVEPIDNVRIRLGDELFESRCLCANLQGLERALAFVSSCGDELEEAAADGDSLHAYWVDVVKELALEAVTAEAERRAAEWYGVEGVAMMNPGSADIDVWPIEAQRALFRLIGDTQAEIGVRLTESLLMIPNKSVSGVLFPSHQGWVSCEACTRQGCMSRRAPYRAFDYRKEL